MKHKMFTVFDSAAGAYLPPFVLPAEAMAVRVFSDCVNSSDHQFGKHPSDYTLFELGVWDDSAGVVSLLPSGGGKIVNGLEVIAEVKWDDAQQAFDLESVS